MPSFVTTNKLTDKNGQVLAEILHQTKKSHTSLIPGWKFTIQQKISSNCLASGAKIDTPAHVGLFFNYAAAFCTGFSQGMLTHAGRISSSMAKEVFFSISSALDDHVFQRVFD